MSLGAAFHESVAPGTAHRAIEFLLDPCADALAYMAERTPSHLRHPADEYPYALGQALAHIGSLLDALGFSEQGPDRFDCEWSVTHPYEDDEVAS